MRFAYRDECLEHDTGGRHPESPDRLRAIRRALSRVHGAEYTAPDPAPVDALEAVHDPEYVEEVRTFCESGGGEWDADTVAVEETWEAARLSAGMAVWAAEAALDGADGHDTPFSLGRPPGHHAEPDDAMGFCFFNNVAVAAETALERDGVDRVAIFDWDVHHGNGTQDAFYDRGDVFYASTHEQALFPGTGGSDETGTGDGEGTNLNVPLSAGADDGDFAALVDDAVAPAIAAFDPDLLLVSAGFDAHERDPISRLRVSTEGYGLLSARMRDLAEETDAALAFVLEGGYSLDALAESVSTVHEVFHGRTPTEPDGEPSEAVAALIEEARAAQGLGSK